METKNMKKDVPLFINRLTVAVCLLSVFLFGGIGAACADGDVPVVRTDTATAVTSANATAERHGERQWR